MRKIFVLGNIGCGKSTFTTLLKAGYEAKNLNTIIVDLDILGGEVLARPGIRKQISQEIAPFETKQELADIVFSSKINQQKLNNIMHDEIYKLLCNKLDVAKSNGIEIVIVEQSVFEGPNDRFAKLADQIIFLKASYEVRKYRCIDRGMTEADFDARNKLQLKDQIYEDCADIVVNNDSMLDSLKKII